MLLLDLATICKGNRHVYVFNNKIKPELETGDNTRPDKNTSFLEGIEIIDIENEVENSENEDRQVDDNKGVNGVEDNKNADLTNDIQDQKSNDN